MIETDRRPYAYRTSHRLEEVDVTLSDGTPAKLLRKDLRWSALHTQARAAKPAFLHNPAREVAAYALIKDLGWGTPQLYESGKDWLLMEKVDGVELWQVGDLGTWADAARWLGRLHRHFEQAPPTDSRLLRYQGAYFKGWCTRAAERHPEISNLVPYADRAIEILSVDRPTLVHGEFYASNIVVAHDRIAPVDWEMAGLGSGMIDLAALLSGWGDDARMAMIAAYGGAREKVLAAAELQIALQWLGWSEAWIPPPEHRRDWVAEARAAARHLGL